VTASHSALKQERSFGRGADRRLARAVMDASQASRRATPESPRAHMLEGLRTAAAAIAAALATVRASDTRAKELTAAARQKKAETALLVACGGVEQALRAVVPPTGRLAPRRLPQKMSREHESSADEPERS
jgi:hypothetical protein